jgi:hypothetical protein
MVFSRSPPKILRVEAHGGEWAAVESDDVFQRG